jgi:hypothetical protein
MKTPYGLSRGIVHLRTLNSQSVSFERVDYWQQSAPVLPKQAPTAPLQHCEALETETSPFPLVRQHALAAPQLKEHEAQPPATTGGLKGMPLLLPSKPHVAMYGLEGQTHHPPALCERASVFC